MPNKTNSILKLVNMVDILYAYENPDFTGPYYVLTMTKEDFDHIFVNGDMPDFLFLFFAKIPGEKTKRMIINTKVIAEIKIGVV